MGWTGRLLCPGSSSVSQVSMSRKWKKSLPAQDRVCAPLLEPSPHSSLFGAQNKIVSCLPQSPVSGVLPSS